MSKIMTLRLDEAQAATLEMVARADGQSLTETVRAAIDAHVEQRRADKDFQDRLSDIIREDQEILERLAR
jgi:Ribbon-helix-helix protein, copG family